MDPVENVGAGNTSSDVRALTTAVGISAAFRAAVSALGAETSGCRGLF
jgi:hypothetical protein